MPTPRKTLEERIAERAAKVEAEKQELARLQAIQDMAGPRSEWVDELLTEFEIPVQDKDKSEEARLALLRTAMSGAAVGLQQQLDETKAALDKSEAKGDRFWKAASAMARDLGLTGADAQETWDNVVERYGV